METCACVRVCVCVCVCVCVLMSLGMGDLRKYLGKAVSLTVVSLTYVGQLNTRLRYCLQKLLQGSYV